MSNDKNIREAKAFIGELMARVDHCGDAKLSKEHIKRLGDVLDLLNDLQGYVRRAAEKRGVGMNSSGHVPIEVVYIFLYWRYREGFKMALLRYTPKPDHIVETNKMVDEHQRRFDAMAEFIRMNICDEDYCTEEFANSDIAVKLGILIVDNVTEADLKVADDDYSANWLLEEGKEPGDSYLRIPDWLSEAAARHRAREKGE